MNITASKVKKNTIHRSLPSKPEASHKSKTSIQKPNAPSSDKTSLSPESKRPGKSGKGLGNLIAGLAANFGHSDASQAKKKDNIVGDKIGVKVGDAGSHPKPAEPDLSAGNIAAKSELANSKNDPAVLNEIDSFRSQLPPDQQKIYDKQLAVLRQDERINFVEHEGAEADLATRDFALRGILTSTFGNQEDLEKALNTSAHNGHNSKGDLVEKKDGNGKLDIHLYPDEFPLDPLKDPKGEKISGGLVISGGDIHASKAFLQNTLKDGENLFTHEFTHVTQGSQGNGQWDSGNDFPEDFPKDLEKRFEKEFRSDRFQDYFEEIGLNKDFGGESYPGVQTVFRYYPEDLKKNSPELYNILTSYNGYDPLKGEAVERQVKEPSKGLLERAGDIAGGVVDFFNPF
jgi:hypothetical protein